MGQDTIGRREKHGRDENAMTNARILVVRSDRPDAEGLEPCLQGLGYNVCAVAVSAAEAIEKAAETAPDAVLMDLDLGADVNGLEAAERIGSELDIPVVCLTDGAEGNPFPAARTAYPFSYVLKPFDGRQLRLTLLTALSLRERESSHRETRSRSERVFRDITGSKATEIRLQQTIGELREQSELLQTILDSIHEGIIVSDQSGEFLYANPGAKEILDREYFVRRDGNWAEKPNEDIYYADRVTRVKNEDLPLPRAIFNGEAADDMIIFILRPNHPNGGTFLSASARPLLDEIGGIRGGVLVFRDVTHQRVLADEALTRAFAQGRLEVVDTILHNIGNAINSVTTGTETLYRSFMNDQLVRRLRALADAIKLHADDWIDYIENDPQGQKVRPFIIALAEDFVRHDRELARTVERVRDRAMHIADIVRTQESPGSSSRSRKDINLRNALSDAIDVVGDSLGNGGIRIDVDCAKAPKEIRTQESQFHQMMVNLIKNSVDAIHELAGSDGLKEEPHIRIGAAVEGNFLKVEVSDNGIGFGDKDTRMFFAAGYTTKEAGTGLGLHSAANFVVGSGGHIDLSSDGVGKGATVRVLLRLPPRLHPFPPIGEVRTPASVNGGEDG